MDYVQQRAESFSPPSTAIYLGQPSWKRQRHAARDLTDLLVPGPNHTVVSSPSVERPHDTDEGSF